MVKLRLPGILSGLYRVPGNEIICRENLYEQLHLNILRKISHEMTNFE